MKKLSLLMMLFLAACAASPEKLNAVAESEAGRLAKPRTALSAFASFELKPMALSPEVKAEPEKVKQAAVLEEKIKAKLEPLFVEWASSSKSGRSGTLVVQPEIVELRIVSGGARFFLGGLTGDSHIDLDLRLVDGDSNNEIASPRITRAAGGFVGGLSIGKSDQNLHDYIAHIVHRYMVDNY